MPEIITIKDYQTLRENEVITRNATAEIKGSDLKVDPSDEEQGVFLVTDTQAVRVTTYLHNKPSHLIFMVPNDAPEGDVRIQICKKAHNNTKLKKETFETSITVL